MSWTICGMLCPFLLDLWTDAATWKSILKVLFFQLNILCEIFERIYIHTQYFCDKKHYYNEKPWDCQITLRKPCMTLQKSWETLRYAFYSFLGSLSVELRVSQGFLSVTQGFLRFLGGVKWPRLLVCCQPKSQPEGTRRTHELSLRERN